MNYTQGEWGIAKVSIGKKIKPVITPTPEDYGKSQPIAVVESLNDAHLIAAAPDMYKALRAIVGTATEKWMLTDEFKALSSAVQQAHKALAKAEGK